MRIAKYIGSLVCAVLALGNLLPIYLIAAGLVGGSVVEGEEAYFLGKLVGHVVVCSLLGYGSYRLWRVARVSEA